MLITSRIGNGQSRFIGGAAWVDPSQQRGSGINPVSNRLRWASEYSAFPVGRRQDALLAPMKDGGISVRLTGDGDLTAAINGLADSAVSLTGSASVSVASYGLTMLLQMAASADGAASVAAAINGRAGMAAEINVSQLSQNDVEGAILDAVIESGVTLKQALRLLLAVAAGKTDINTSGPNPIVTFRDVNDTKDRIVATMTGSERTTITKDVT